MKGHPPYEYPNEKNSEKQDNEDNLFVVKIR